MHAALFAALAVDGVHWLPPALICATTVRWPGMIQKNTLALMAVAIIAPTSKGRAAPKPVAGQPRGHAHQHEDQRAHDGVAVFCAGQRCGRWRRTAARTPRRRQSATMMAVAGAQSIFDLSRVGAGAVEVRHREQRKAAEPGAVALPKEPVQVFGQLRR